MTTIEISALERTLSDAFHGGEVLRRELRLSREEAEFLRSRAILTPMPGASGDKAWYEVRFKGALEL